MNEDKGKFYRPERFSSKPDETDMDKVLMRVKFLAATFGFLAKIKEVQVGNIGRVNLN